MQINPNTASSQLGQRSRLVPQDYFIKDMSIVTCSPVSSCEYLSTSNLICLGCQDGVIRVIGTNKQGIQYELSKQDKSPITCLASTSPTSTLKNTIMACHWDGTLEYWHTTSKQLLFSKKHETILQACQISTDSQNYAISGEKGEIFVGHLDKGNPSALETGQLGAHANRVFCIKWHPQDNQIFFSGGWDKAVFMWDLRTKTSVKSLYGYYIGGQSIDVRGSSVLLGNNQNEKQLRVFDLKAEKTRNILWQNYSESSSNITSGVNNCFFGSKDDEIIAMTSRNEIRYFKDDKCQSLFKHENEDARGYSMVACPSEKSFVASWNTCDVRVMAF